MGCATERMDPEERFRYLKSVFEEATDCERLIAGIRVLDAKKATVVFAQGGAVQFATTKKLTELNEASLEAIGFVPGYLEGTWKISVS